MIDYLYLFICLFNSSCKDVIFTPKTVQYSYVYASFFYLLFMLLLKLAALKLLKLNFMVELRMQIYLILKWFVYIMNKC